MTSISLSTLAAREALRAAVVRSQQGVEKATREVATSRFDDVGLQLGSRVSGNLSMRAMSSELETIGQTNATTKMRLDQTQSALSSMVELADGFFNIAVNAQHPGSDRSLLVTEAKSRLSSMISLLSTTTNGSNIFSGTNSSTAPLEEYLKEPPSAARTAITAGFAAEFGFPPDDPAASSISQAQFDAYMDGTFAAQFDDPQWQANFSAANDTPIRSRIGLNEAIETHVSANSPGIRDFISALVAVIDSGSTNVNADVFQSLAARASKAASQASADIVQVQAGVGMAQQRLTSADERLWTQKQVLDSSVDKMEEVDPMEASTRLSLLTTKLEASYAVTARLQNLTLLNYL